MENLMKIISKSVFSYDNQLFQLKENVEFYRKFLGWRNLLVLKNKDSGTMLHLLSFNDLTPIVDSEWFSPVSKINGTNEVSHE